MYLLEWNFLFVHMQTAGQTSVSHLVKSYEFNIELDEQCQFTMWWITPVISMIPFYWRFMQCVKRYYDSKLFFPHMVNAGKYLTSISVFWASTWAHVNGTSL